MNFANVRRVFRKELRETLRDRRTLFIMLVVPIFLYPTLLVVVEQLALFGRRQLEEAPVTVIAQGASAELVALMEADGTIRITPAAESNVDVVATGEADLFLGFGSSGVDPGSDEVRMYFDGSRDRSTRARALATRRLNQWSDTLLARRLAAEGLPATFAHPLIVSDSSVASAERMGGYALGRFLPMLLILMTLLGAFYPAIDLSAGEKERGTLETLLTTPVPAREIVAGKFLTVALIAISAAVLNLASMLLTFQYAAFQFAEAMEVQFSLPWTTILLVVLFLVPLAVFFSAIFLGMALRAQSFKEAQNVLTPVQLASTVPMMLPLIPGMTLTYGLAVVPIGGVALLFRDLMTGGAPLGPAALALGTTILYAGLALRFAAASFGREDVLFGAGGDAAARSLRERWAAWRSQNRSVPSPTEALTFVALVALAYFYLGITIQARFGESGILASQLLLLALPAILFAMAGPFAARETLSLRLPTPRGLGAALLIILGGMPIGWALAWVQSLFLEVPAEFVTALEDLVRAETAGEIAWLLLLVALTPAICEELVFRGVLLRGLGSGMSAMRSIGLSAVVFGAFHLSFETAIRFLPSAWLGLLLGFAVWRTRSVVTGMAMHLVNNGLIVLILAYPALENRLIGSDGEPSWWLLSIGILLLAAGYRLIPNSTVGASSTVQPDR